MNIEEIENFLSENDDSFSQKSVLKKWENEISYMIEKKAKQRTILNFILQKDEEIAKTYENRMATLQSMLSQFCARLKKNKSKTRRKSNEDKVESNSSTSSEVEEQNKDSSILSKINDKKQEREKKSFLPPDYIDGREELNKILKK